MVLFGGYVIFKPLSTNQNFLQIEVLVLKSSFYGEFKEIKKIIIKYHYCFEELLLILVFFLLSAVIVVWPSFKTSTLQLNIGQWS